jgi:hypothetical protein
MKKVFSEIDTVTRKVEGAVGATEKIVVPVRNTLFKRFPILLTLLVTFGIVATFYGVEGMIEQVPWLHDRPFLIFLSGISALLFTGKLYQKLG